MDVTLLFTEYDNFKELTIKDRFFKHAQVEQLLGQLPSKFKVKPVGYSEEGRSINLVEWGKGPSRIFLWSQMHGDEPTGTMALFDLFNFLNHQNYLPAVNMLFETCTLYMLPMSNPDGAERFTRRNSRQLDINRDYIAAISKEAKLLRSLRAEINPAFGFNLHDQSTLWSVEGSLKSATLSFLAPSFDQFASWNDNRTKAMMVIVDMYIAINKLLPGRIGLFPDEYEPRAFGDNFQREGTSTLLLEAGGFKDDHDKQEVRKYFFLSILQGLLSISSRSYLSNSATDYSSIPKNGKEIFHMLIRNVKLNGMSTNLGLNYEDDYCIKEQKVTRRYFVTDIGDLRFSNAYKTFDSDQLLIHEMISIDSLANFRLLEGNKILLTFHDGILNAIL